MNAKPPPEMRPDSELRDMVLRVLHRQSERTGVTVRPADFEPPVSRHDIWRIGIQLRDMGYLKSTPGDMIDGWWMRISTEGILHAEENL
jgi:hypothetical protein